MTPQDKFVTVYGQKIHYLEAGSGAVVILLHGLGSDTSDWSKVIAPLSKHYRVIAPDQIGAGQSDKPFINYRPMTWVDFIGGFYQALKIDRASLVGHSMGGATAAMFAIAHPTQVDRLVLVDAGYGYAIPKVSDPNQLGHNPGTLHLINPATRAEARQLLSLAVYDPKTVASEAAVDELFATSARSGYANQRFIESFMRREDVLDGKLNALRSPTLIVQGREDKVTPLALSERLHHDIAGSDLLIVNHCGHSPNVEQADQLNAAVLRFLNGKAVTTQ